MTEIWQSDILLGVKVAIFYDKLTEMIFSIFYVTFSLTQNWQIYDKFTN